MVARGSVWWVELDKRRPCVVVSSDDVLGVDVWQTHVVPITSNTARAGLAGNVLLPSSVSGLPTDSVAVPLGLELIDRSLLESQTGRLPIVLIEAIDRGLRAVLGTNKDWSSRRVGRVNESEGTDQTLVHGGV